MGFLFRNDADAQGPYIIAGLGNPGEKYAHTRHNMGFDAVDLIARNYHIELNHRKFQGIYGKGTIEGQSVLLVKPQTYMNCSGQCLGQMVRYFKSDPAEKLIVLCDDIHLAPGHIRVRAKGSAGGHNGLKDIIAQTGTDGFTRIRIGVGEDTQEDGLIGHVLGRMPQEDAEKIDEALQHTAEAVALILDGRMDEAMNRFNRKEKG